MTKPKFDVGEEVIIKPPYQKEKGKGEIIGITEKDDTYHYHVEINGETKSYPVSWLEKA